MFSGNCPFFDNKNDLQLMVFVKRGKRPSRPPRNLHQARGLNDSMWRIIEACWDTIPHRRPKASQITEYLRTLPGQPADLRPLDDFDISFPSQVLHTQLNNPFSTLTTSIGGSGQDEGIRN